MAQVHPQVPSFLQQGKGPAIVQVLWHCVGLHTAVVPPEPPAPGGELDSQPFPTFV